jgi:hypothetical protein
LHLQSLTRAIPYLLFAITRSAGHLCGRPTRYCLHDVITIKVRADNGHQQSQDLYRRIFSIYLEAVATRAMPVGMSEKFCTLWTCSKDGPRPECEFFWIALKALGCRPGAGSHGKQKQLPCPHGRQQFEPLRLRGCFLLSRCPVRPRSAGPRPQTATRSTR